MISDPIVAARINDLMIDFGGKLDESIALVMERCSPDEFKTYRKAAGTVMAEMLLGIMNPLYKQHPELRPREME